ncbi:MAG: MATE family efflux transporter [Chthoniobacterales bacterium]
MKDLTQGSVLKHLVQMASFLAVSMAAQTLYLLADLYWVGRLGKEAIAAVGVAGNLTMIVLAVTQMLGVGTTTLIAQAAGRKDQPQAELILNQSLVLSLAVALGLGVLGFFIRVPYANSLSADRATAALAHSYLVWFIPALVLQFPLVALGSALRATGIVKPAVALQVLSVFLNIVLAPLLVFGLVGLPRLGVTGAALATFISILIADVLMVFYFLKKYDYLRFRRKLWRPQFATWWAMLRIGLPAGAEFAVLFLFIVIVYGIIRDFGPAAQAGFGVGARVMQSLFLPVVALSFAIGPIVGQNFGGRHADRVRQSVKVAIGLAAAIMLVLAVLTHFLAGSLLRPFSNDPRVIAFGSEYLRIAAFNFVAAGIVFSSSSVFQGLGHTIPPLLSSLLRVLLFALPALWLSRQPGFALRYLWYLSVASQLLQAGINLLLLRRELHRKLVFPALTPGAATT